MKDPKVELKLTSGDYESKIIGFEGNEMYDPTVNPTLAKSVIFQDINLPTEPLLWPFLQILVYDEAERSSMVSKLLGDGIPSMKNAYFTSVCLIDYAAEILIDKDRLYAKA